MQGHDRMYMPMPQVGTARIPSTNYGPYPVAASYYPPQTSNYGATTYGSQVPPPSTTSLMDRSMATLIENLRVSIENASNEELEILLQNEDKLNALIEETPQVNRCIYILLDIFPQNCIFHQLLTFLHT